MKDESGKEGKLGLESPVGWLTVYKAQPRK